MLYLFFALPAFVFIITKIIIQRGFSNNNIFGIQWRIDTLILAKPEILTNFKLARNHSKTQLPNKDFEFPFNYWMDMTRVHKVDSLSEYSIVNVEYYVEFGDEKTKQSYEGYVDQIKTDLAAEYNVNKNDIVSRTTFKIGDQKEGFKFGKKFYCIMDYITIFPLTGFMMASFLNNMNFPKFKVKKIISQSAVEIEAF